MNKIHVGTCLLVAVVAFAATPAQADYTTEVKIYLDVDAGVANDSRFDFTSAISHPDDDPEDAGDDPSDGICAHARDFAFNCGFYNDGVTLPTLGGANRFICSASNGTGRPNSVPSNPARTPQAITTTGWYTFKHTFRDNAGILAVDLEIIDAGNTVVATWTLPTVTDPMDIIGVFIGGNRYGWFPNNENSVVTAIDDSQRCSGTCPFVQDFEVNVNDGTVGWFTPVRVASGTNGIPSATGSFHAELAGGDFTRWGGYECVFPVTSAAPIPTVSEWGLIFMGVLLIGGLGLVLRRLHAQDHLSPA